MKRSLKNSMGLFDEFYKKIVIHIDEYFQNFKLEQSKYKNWSMLPNYKNG
jgi:hypothetical protein